MATLKVRAHWSRQSAGVTAPAPIAAYGTPPDMPNNPIWPPAAGPNVPAYTVWVPLVSQADLDDPSTGWGSGAVPHPHLPPAWPSSSGAAANTYDQGYGATATDFAVTSLRIWQDLQGQGGSSDFVYTVVDPSGMVTIGPIAATVPWTTVPLTASIPSGKGFWTVYIERAAGSGVAAPGLLQGSPPLDESYVSPYGHPDEGLLGIEFSGDEVACPAISGTVQVGACDASGNRPVTFLLAFAPAIPSGSGIVPSVSIAYGGNSASGSPFGLATITSPTTATLTDTFPPGSYTPVAALSVQGLTCSPSVVALSNFTVPTCWTCPTNVGVNVTTPKTGPWCVPPNGVASGVAQILATVAWPAGVNHPLPSAFDWSVTFPDLSTQATQAGVSPNVAGAPDSCQVDTGQGWSGTGSNALQGLNLSQTGTYTIAVQAKYPVSAGLSNCVLLGSGSFTLGSCSATVTPPCPTVHITQVNTDCADPAASKSASITFVATVSDPAGIATGIAWDFGDPSSGAANQASMPPGMPTAMHVYASPGSYAVTATVTTTTACTGAAGGGGAALAAVVAECPCPAGTTRDASGKCVPNPPPPPPPPPGGSALSCSLLCTVAGILLIAAPIGGLIAGVAYCASAINIALQSGLILAAIGVFLALCGECCLWIFLIIGAVIGIVATAIASYWTGLPACWLNALFVAVGFIITGIGMAIDCARRAGKSRPPPPSAAASAAARSSMEARPARGGAGTARLAADAPPAAGVAQEADIPGEGTSRSDLHATAARRAGGEPAPPTAASGLGDRVQHLTRALGVPACAGCRRRAEWLNALAPAPGARDGAAPGRSS